MSIFRNSVWFVKGLREYTKSGYQAACKSFDVNDLQVDCSGKSYMITGANSGLGKTTALELAKRGGTIHMVCRNAERGEEAKQDVIKESNNQDIHLHILDMSKPRDVTKFATDFASSGKRLNVLINNAGCMVNERQMTTDGLEKNFATNTLGTHVLTVNLIPVLLKAEKPRVIIVTSGGMLVQKLNVEDLQLEKVSKFEGTMAYAQNKRQQVVMTQEYAKKWREVHFSTMHPGWADTPAVRMSMPDFYEKMKDRLRTAEQGADTLVWLAIASKALAQQSGLFFQDRKAVATHLPLAWTKSKVEEDELLMLQLNQLSDKFKAIS